MISWFRCSETERIWEGAASSRFPSEIQESVRRKLRMVDAAVSLMDLRALPGNRLEKLSGDRAGQWSIRVNDQYRLCFVWADGHAGAVELVDYH